MKTEFGMGYVKKENAGFVGKAARVYTPSREDVVIAVFHQMSYMLATDNYQYLIELAQKSSIYSSRKQQEDVFIDALYFEWCMLDCGNKGCREWSEVYDWETHEPYYHVSECQLEEFRALDENKDESVKKAEEILEKAKERRGFKKTYNI